VGSRLWVGELAMERLHKNGPVERRPAETDHTAAWLAGILLVIAVMVIAVLMGDSIAFPVG
jgi:hypothetical protein